MSLSDWPEQPIRHPDLDERFQPPAGLHFYALDRGEYSLRCSLANPDTPAKALVILLPGLRRPIETLYEMMHSLLDQHYAVACIDWRGQGASPRYDRKNPEIRGSQGFSQDAEDLRALIASLRQMAAFDSLPLFAVAHSMGANILCHTMAGQPDLFDKTVLCAPMMGITIPLFGQKLGLKIADMMIGCGLGQGYLPGHKAWSKSYETLLWSLLSQDKQRRSVQLQWLEFLPQLRLGGVNWYWLRDALQACHAIRPEAIETPSLVILAAKEHLVRNHSARRCVQNMPNVTLIEFPDAMHEIMMETDNIRDSFLDETFRFFNA